jgi:hypothetical protein
MQTLASFVRMELQVLLLALAFVVAFQLLTGKINLDGLLHDKVGTALGGFSPARLQLLLTTLAGAFYFAAQIATSLHNATPEHPAQFPDIPDKWLLMLSGSYSIYLGGKVGSLLGFIGHSDANSPPQGASK